ncbi:MAG: hypothetical protein H6822_13435 [Planctomycetaceae bacterium]|nr:hypothetical protein [Planctomycetales bacterium]MCB9923179.1 hypothetical protein [Planctomycetaceae bacterium]
MAGADLPPGKQLDWKDIWDALQAGENPQKDEAIFALRHWNGFHNVGVRRSEWKAPKRGPNSPWQLFNLNEDIGESTDVSTQHPKLVSQMVASARERSRSHTSPRWFDNLKAEKDWKDKGMPRYDSTFAFDSGKTKLTTKQRKHQ